MPELRRTILTGHNDATILTWIDDDILHLAINDFGDSDYEGDGIDIQGPRSLCSWLVNDRFDGNPERLSAYCVTYGIAAPTIDLDEPNQTIFNTDWRSVTVLLIHDRCEGHDAWGRVRELLDASGTPTIANFRGYV